MEKLVCLIFVIHFSIVVSWEGPEVTVPFGKIKGTWEDSFEEKRYSAFQGIPYAKPPISNLRFEESVPIGPWDGTWPAIVSHWCAQIDVTSVIYTGEIKGNEDCLYLNIFVPGEKINRTRKYDVFVDIHGGAFMIGSASLINNPQYIMDNMDEMILVAINYRVGLFGFLSTEDDSIPGNNGMKDQVLALKWVKENIEYFGGNPDSITLSGYSAGGASVHLHTLSPMSRGLFHKAHIGSGSAFSPWVIKEKPLEFAQKLAAATGCPTEPSHLLKHCLKTRPANVLLSVYEQFYGYGQMPFSPFAVVVEKNGTNPFLSKLPYELVKEGHMADIPLVFSVVKDEGLYPSGYYCKEPEKIENIWTDVAHYLLDYNYTLPLEERIDVARKIKDLYMGPGAKINEATFFNFTKIFSDRDFIVATEEAAKLHAAASKSPVYFYYFNYQSPNISSSALYCEEGDIGGIAHASDAINCFGFSLTKYLSKSDKDMKEKCHELYSAFAKTGVPVFDANVSWRPTSGDELMYLNITGPDNVKMEKTKSLSHAEFWRKLGLAENEKDVFPNTNIRQNL
nr:venom carboxylesterase [Phaedon brassicae]